MSYIHKRTGIKISANQYQSLRSWDKSDYELVNDHDIVDTIVDVGIGMALGDMLFGDSNNSSSDNPSSDSSFEGFGGGEFGGGGAGDGW
jgi:uncharacterized membrane protein YgcG